MRIRTVVRFGFFALAAPLVCLGSVPRRRKSYEDVRIATYRWNRSSH